MTVKTEPSKRAPRYRSTADSANGRDRLVRMPQGLIGFESRTTFAWATTSDTRFASYRVLRSVDDPELAFLVAPLSEHPNLIASVDLEDACLATGLPPDDAEWFLIVTPWFADDAVRATANLRAPLLLDRLTGTARQVVLASEQLAFRYPV